MRESHRGKALRVFIGVYIFVVVLALFPFSPSPAGDIKLLVTSWAGAVLACALIGIHVRHGGSIGLPTLFGGILCAFLLLHLLSSLASPFLGWSLTQVNVFWALFLLYVAAVQAYRRPDQVRRLALIVCLAMTLSSLYGFCQYLGCDPFPWSESVRSLDEYTHLPATLGNPNLAAHVLILAIIFAVWLGTSQGMRWVLLLLPILVGHFLYTRQRAGLAAIGAALMLCVVARLVSGRIRKPVRAVVATLLIAVALTAAGLAAGTAVLKLATGTALPVGPSVLLRYNAACSTSRMILARPLLGWGTGSFAMQNAEFWTPYEEEWFATTHKFNAHGHCDVLEVGAEAGLLASALYLVLFAVAVAWSLYFAFSTEEAEYRRLGYAFAAFFAAFFIDGLFGFNLRAPVSSAVFFLALGAFEGVRQTRPAVRFPDRLTACTAPACWAVGALGVAGALFATQVFVGQMYLQRARGAMHYEEYGAAAQILERGEHFAPWSWEYPYELGRVLAASGDRLGAMAQYERALARRPCNFNARIELARTSFNHALDSLLKPEEQARYVSDAARHAQKALDICSLSTAANELLGRIAFVQAESAAEDNGNGPGQPEWVHGKWVEAESRLRKAVRYAGSPDPNSYNMLARALLALNDPAGAETALLRAVQLDPYDEISWENFFRFAEQTGGFNGLRFELDRQIERIFGELHNAPDPVKSRLAADLQVRLAQVLDKGSGLPDDAGRTFRMAVRRAPQSTGAWAAFARFCIANDRPEVLRGTVLKSFAGLAARGVSVHAALEAAARVWGDGSKAAPGASEMLVQALEAGSAPPQDLTWAADEIARVLGRENIQESLSYVWANLAIVYAAAGELGTAGDILNAVWPKLSAEARMRAGWAWHQALRKGRRYGEALEIVKELSTMAPHDPRIRLALARTLAAMGKDEEARLEYIALLQWPGWRQADRKAVKDELGRLSG